MSGSGDDRQGRRAALWLVGLVGAYGVYLTIFLPLFPSVPASIGQDYALHYPNLLVGYYWFLNNGLFSIPWFSPAQCGGVPFYPDFNVAYFSVPQFASFALGPVRAVWLTVALFAALGAFGSYRLARHSFGLSADAAVFSAVVFLFNGFFVTRMAVGHLTFHAFALAPWVATFIIGGRAPATDGGWRPAARLGARIAGTGICFAYMVESGMVNGILPLAVGVFALMALHSARNGGLLRSVAVAAASAALGGALAAPKLVAGLSLMKQFPRTFYTLGGFTNLLDAIEVPLRALFWGPPVAYGNNLYVNSMWRMGRHEWEYAVGPVVLVVLLIAGFLAATSRRTSVGAAVKTGSRRLWIGLGLFLACLVVPVALNVYTPGWNAVLKSLPVLRNSSNLLRFYAAYIVILAPVSAMALAWAFEPGKPRAKAALVACLAVVAFAATRDLAYYRGQGGGTHYDGRAIVAAFAKARASGRPVSILENGVTVNREGHIVHVLDGNNIMANGYSQIFCYQPIFGYRLEKFPRAPLQPGPVLDRLGPVLNIKNPACYVFPAANKCQPGDQFPVSDEKAASAFASYRPYSFARPRAVGIAEGVAVFGALLAALGLGLGTAAAWVSRGRKG